MRPGPDILAASSLFQAPIIIASQEAEVFLGVAGNNPDVRSGASVRFVHCMKADYTVIVNGDNFATQSRQPMSVCVRAFTTLVAAGERKLIGS